MAIPAYLWLKDDGGANITGSVDVQHREGSIEVLGFGHGLHLPTDSATGKITGTRVHSALNFEKNSIHQAHIFIKLWRMGKRYNQRNLSGTELTTLGRKLNTSICILKG